MKKLFLLSLVLSLPCTLWFFDRAKRLENCNRVLFIDAALQGGTISGIENELEEQKDERDTHRARTAQCGGESADE